MLLNINKFEYLLVEYNIHQSFNAELANNSPVVYQQIFSSINFELHFENVKETNQNNTTFMVYMFCFIYLSDFLRDK
jgi:hypothetical protein